MEDAPKNLAVAELRLGPKVAPAPGRTSLVLSRDLGGCSLVTDKGSAHCGGPGKATQPPKADSSVAGGGGREEPCGKLAMNSTLRHISHAPRESAAARTLHFRWQLRGGSAKRLSQLQPTVKITLSLLLSSNRCLL